MKIKTLFKLIVSTVMGFLGIIIGLQKRTIQKQSARIDIQEQKIEHADKQAEIYQEVISSTEAETVKQSRIQSETDAKVQKLEEATDVQEVIDRTNDDIATWNAR